MNKYIPVTDLNEIKRLIKKGDCFAKDGAKYLWLASSSPGLNFNTEYYRLNPDYKEPEKGCGGCTFECKCPRVEYCIKNNFKLYEPKEPESSYGVLWKPKDPPALPESIKRIIFGCFGPYENDVKILMEAMWQEIIKEIRK